MPRRQRPIESTITWRRSRGYLSLNRNNRRVKVTAREVWLFLLEKAPVPKEEVAHHFRCGPATIENKVRRLRVEYRVPVYHSSRGYRIYDPEEVEGSMAVQKEFEEFSLWWDKIISGLLNIGECVLPFLDHFVRVVESRLSPVERLMLSSQFMRLAELLACDSYRNPPPASN